MTVEKRYTRFVYRVWRRLEERTGHAPTYVDARHVVAYCPACLDGTLLVTFVERPAPAYTVRSNVHRLGSECSREVVDFVEAWGAVLDEPQGCSNGCTEDAIHEALFA